MSDCNPCITLFDLQSKLAADCSPPVQDATHFKNLAASPSRGLMCHMQFHRCASTCTILKSLIWWPSCASYNIFMALRSLVFSFTDPPPPSSSSTLMLIGLGVQIPIDPPRATRCFLGITWSPSLPSVRTSSPARVLRRNNALSPTAWPRPIGCNGYSKSSIALCRSTLIYCNNVCAVYLSTDPIQHHCMKHVEIDLHFVREKVAIGEVHVLHVPTSSQFADIFTKGLSSLFLEFQSSLNICSG
jgi:hypothetical protein